MNEATQEQAQEPASTEAATEVQTSPARPEWLPEKYKSAEDLAKAYKELEGKLGTKETDLRAKLSEELKAEAYKDRPKSAGDYKLPEGVDETSAVDNEMLKWWSELSYESGYGQDKFQKGIEMYNEAMKNGAPDIEAEMKKLGESANDRISAASAFANKFFPKDALPAVARMCETSDGIVALEAVMEAMKDGSFAADATTSTRLDEGKLQEMMRDERYFHPAKRDPSFIRQVEAGFKKLYG